MRFFRLSFLIVPFLLAASSACFGQAPGMAMKPTPLLVAKVSEYVPALTREYRGAAEAIETVHVIARVSGLLEKVNFQEGTVVEKGALLFNIEQTEYIANLRAAKAQVVSCESDLKQKDANIVELNAKIKYAQANYDRCKQLFERGGAGSEDDVDNALASLDSLKAQLEAARAAVTNAEGQLELAKSKVDIAEFDLSHTTIYSPIKGRVGRLTYSQGNYITPSNGALVSIAQLDPIYVRFSISETDFVSLFESADELRSHTEMQIRLADNSVFKGKGRLRFIDNKVTNLDTIQVWAELENPEGILNPGGIVKVQLRRSGTKAFPSLPASGIMHDDRGEFVYVVVENKRPDGSTVQNIRKRQIQLGPADGNTQCVAKGLDLDEVVVIGGTNKVNPLMLVDENGVCIANPQMPALPIKTVYNQEELDIEEAQTPPAGPPAAGKGPAAPQGAPAKPEGKDAKNAADPNGGAAR